jgi:CRISPR-associated protein Csh1
MSLAYKLKQIGDVLTKDDILDSVITSPETKDPTYINIDFALHNGSVTGFRISADALSRDNFVFTVKMGGSGTGMYYMFPNLAIKDEPLNKKLPQLINSLRSSTSVFANDCNKSTCEAVLEYFDDNEKLIEEQINNYKKGNYIFWLSVNGKTFSELMPEVIDNWYENPVDIEPSAKEGVDFFTGEKTDIGYKPDFKVFSYDNYHSSLSHRVVDNIPLSKESAVKIKFAWIYILKNLVFYFKGIEYIIIPNVLSGSPEVVRMVIRRLRMAHLASKENSDKLRLFYEQEKKLTKDIKKLNEKKKLTNDEQLRISELSTNLQSVSAEVAELERGLVAELSSNADHLEELKNSVILGFIFTDINRTNLSFSIKGSLEDIIPSRLSEVVRTMKDCNIADAVKLGKRDKESVLLQDFFHRYELLYALTKSSKKNSNTILKEQLYIARLLLTDEKISMDDLLQRFEFNREFDYLHKKRMKNNIKTWISYPTGFVKNETAILHFLRTLNKIKEQ